MDMETTPRRVHTRANAGALVLGLVTVILSAGGAAQTPRGILLESGLHTFPKRHTARVTVAEVGDSRASSRVTIELRDVREQVLARTAGVLRAGQPILLDLPLSDVLTQLRATVSIVSFSATSRSSTTFEDVDVDSLTVIPKVYCSGPASGRDSPQAYCPGWEPTSFVP